MAARNSKSRTHGGKSRNEIRLRGTRIPGLDKEIALVRTGPPKKRRSDTRRSDEADVVVQKLGKALGRPGINKLAIFVPPGVASVFAYSVDPFDPSKVVREAFDGTKRIGRVVSGKFKLS